MSTDTNTYAKHQDKLHCACARHARPFAAPWIVAARLPCPWGSPGKNAGVGCHFLLQGICPTQESNPHLSCLPYWQADSPPLQHLGGHQDDTVQFSAVAQACPTLCDPMNRSTPGLPVHHQLPEFTQTHVHPAISPLFPSSPPAPNPFQHQSLFQ